MGRVEGQVGRGGGWSVVGGGMGMKGFVCVLFEL